MDYYGQCNLLDAGKGDTASGWCDTSEDFEHDFTNIDDFADTLDHDPEEVYLPDREGRATRTQKEELWKRSVLVADEGTMGTRRHLTQPNSCSRVNTLSVEQSHEEAPDDLSTDIMICKVCG